MSKPLCPMCDDEGSVETGEGWTQRCSCQETPTPSTAEPSVEQRAREFIERAQRVLAEDGDYLTDPTRDELAWLAAQLADWPNRVDENCTTNDGFLRRSAAAFITKALQSTDEVVEVLEKIVAGEERVSAIDALLLKLKGQSQ